MKKRFLAALLCLCLLVGLVPGMGTTAFAAGSYNIGDTVTFAGYDWYIIGTKSEGVTAPEGYYTLFAKNNDFGSTAFRAGASNADSTANHYKDSDLQKKMEEIANGFSAEDKANIAARDTLDDIAGDSPIGQLLWPISEAEGERLEIDVSLRAFPDNYWTRGYRNTNDVSPVYNGIAFSSKGGYMSAQALAYGNGITNTYAIRPALYVKAEVLDDDPPIVIPGTEFTLQPQTQYAVEGGSITFTAKAEAAGAEITETGKYKWQAQLPGSEIWYDMQMWNGQIKNQVGQIIAEEGASGNGGEHHILYLRQHLGAERAAV